LKNNFCVIPYFAENISTMTILETNSLGTHTCSFNNAGVKEKSRYLHNAELRDSHESPVYLG
jgi:hypothetical protein